MMADAQYDIYINMANFIERLHLASRTKYHYQAIIGLGFLAFGATCGFYKSQYQSSIENQNYSEGHLKQYISEDQINEIIDKTGKPAVLYYYQPGVPHNYIVRHDFIRGSHLGHQNAEFYLVNLTKKLEKTIPELQHKFPLDQYLMEIRFPKGNCSVLYTDGESQQKVDYRRQFYNHTYKQTGGVQCFLEENGIIQAKDPMADFLNLNLKCIFEPLKQ